jgi:hypothetical protein
MPNIVNQDFSLGPRDSVHHPQFTYANAISTVVAFEFDDIFSPKRYRVVLQKDTISPIFCFLFPSRDSMKRRALRLISISNANGLQELSFVGELIPTAYCLSLLPGRLPNREHPV